MNGHSFKNSHLLFCEGSMIWICLFPRYWVPIRQFLKTIADTSFLLQYIERLERPVCYIIGFLQAVPWFRWWKPVYLLEKMFLFLFATLSCVGLDALRYRMSPFLQVSYQMLTSIITTWVIYAVDHWQWQFPNSPILSVINNWCSIKTFFLFLLLLYMWVHFICSVL